MSRALTRSATLALIAALSGTAFAQETKPEESNPPKPAEPAPPPADQATPPPAEAPPLAPAPAPYTSSQVDVGLTPVGTEPAVRKNRLIFLVGLGYTAGGAVKHPDLQGDKFSGEMLELGFGTELSPQWRLVLAFSSFQTKLERVPGTNQFKNTSGAVYGGAGFHPLAGCADCSTTGGQGGVVVRHRTSARLPSVRRTRALLRRDRRSGLDAGPRLPRRFRRRGTGGARMAALQGLWYFGRSRRARSSLFRLVGGVALCLGAAEAHG